MTMAAGAQLTLPVSQRDHHLGPLSAPAVLVEYGDYECPYCGAAHPVVTELKRRLGDQICLVYRHFPLTRIHPRAEHAAEAAEAAGAQGRFWPMHDTLFEHQDALDDESLLTYAVELGLDARRLAADLNAGTHQPRVREDFLSGVRSGVNGTPTFFINGWRHEGAADLPALLAAIAAAVA
jgi:protein-disulfide isomerase